MADEPRAGTRAGIEVSLLGSFAVRISGQDAAGTLPRAARLLFAYLLTRTDRKASRSAIERDLWGDAHPDPAIERAGALRVLRDRFAGAAGGALFAESESGDLGLRPEAPLRCDADELERTVTAATAAAASGAREEAVQLALAGDRLYEGHLLEGWNEPWLLVPREAALRRYLEALDLLLRAFESQGDHARVVLYATRALAAAPLHESAHWHLISSLHRLGDDAGALRHYERMAEALGLDARSEPDPSRRAIADAIRAGAARALGRKRETAA